MRVKYTWVAIIVFLYWLLHNLFASVFLRNNDKINVVFFGDTTRYYSIDKKGLDYYLTFPANARVLVPGGYGYYRAGALSKLASLEKNPDLIRKTFSSATSSMVDLYFYPPESRIFYEQSDRSGLNPSLYAVFFNPGNANFIDRFFIFWSLVGRGKNSYKEIKVTDNYVHDDFMEDHMGVFYKRSYRQSKLNVQIIYPSSYNTAHLISGILDGEGIRVVDLTMSGDDPMNKCSILGSRENINSVVVDGMKKFFNCRVEVGETTVSDIILKLGTLEKDWAAD